jgi:hypothetical protein
MGHRDHNGPMPLVSNHRLQQKPLELRGRFRPLDGGAPLARETFRAAMALSFRPPRSLLFQEATDSFASDSFRPLNALTDRSELSFAWNKTILHIFRGLAREDTRPMQIVYVCKCLAESEPKLMGVNRIWEQYWHEFGN